MGALAIGVVGAGAVAQDYLAVAAQADDLDVVAVVDCDPRAAEAAAARCGGVAQPSVGAMLSAGGVDAALVLTPPATHEPLALELLAAGLPVLCEKPIATSSASAARMFQAASRAGVALMMASKFRYVPDMQAARAMVARGDLGDIVLLDNAFCAPVDMVGRWNSDHAVAGGGVLIDNGCHAVDIVRFLLGPLVRIWGHFGRRTTRIDVEDTVRLVIETAGSAVAQVDLSWAVDKGNDYYVGLQGTRATLQLGWAGSRWRAHGERAWREFGDGYDKRSAFAAQLRNFAAVIRGEEAPLVTAQDAVESLRAIEAAYRSARTGRWVPLHTSTGSS